jgi:hypothetical protein
MFLEFDEIDSLIQKNNYSVSSLSCYMSNNSLINSSLVLTEINSIITPFSSVFSLQEFEQHLHPSNVFFLLPLLYAQFLQKTLP